MGQQRIYTNSRGDCRLHTSGFSWLAAIVFPAWALKHGLYKTALAVFVLNFLINIFISATVIKLFCAAVLIVIYGFFSNRFHAYVLERAGYRITAQEPPLLPASMGRDAKEDR
jgi:hypothetical protein